MEEALPRLGEAIRRGLELVRSGHEAAAERLAQLGEWQAVLEGAVEGEASAAAQGAAQ